MSKLVLPGDQGFLVPDSERVRQLEKENEQLRSDNVKLAHEVNRLRTKAGEQPVVSRAERRAAEKASRRGRRR